MLESASLGIPLATENGATLQSSKTDSVTHSHRASKRSLYAIVTAMLVIFACAATANAADVHVETTGADSVSCGAPGDPCLTVAQAVTNSISGDTIAIGAGVFPVTNSIRPAAKSLIIEGEGPTVTQLDGGNSNAYIQDGMLWFGTSGTTQIVRDLGLINIGKRAAATNRFGIVAQPTPSNPANAIDLTVENVHVTTGNPPGGQYEIAVMAANNNGTVLIDGLITDNLTGNHILAERQRGALTVRDSSFTRNASGTMIYDMLHGGSIWNSTGLHLYENNTFSATAAIRVVGGWEFGWNPTTSSYPAGVTITGNDVTVPAVVNTSSAISATNSASTGTPSDGQISNLQITNNSVTGNPGNGNGILVSGQIDGATISGNDVRDFSRGIYLARFAPSYSCSGSPPNPCPPVPHEPINTTVVRNQIVGNTDGLVADASGTIAATAINNWFGCNAGPGNAGCDSVSQPGSSIDADPWAVMTLTPAATTLATAASTTTTAAINSNSDGNPIAGFLADGTIIDFTATGGSVSPMAAPTTSSSTAPTFTSNVATGRSVTATYDNQPLTYTWDDYDDQDPVITITSPVNNSSVNTPSVILEYTVMDNLDPNPDCTPLSGSSIALTEGANTIVVTCEDAAGNIGTASVNVQLDTASPVVNIITPQDNTTVANSVLSTTLSFLVADFGDPSPNCTPANGSIIPLVDGLNTITVTCVDAAGNVGTDSVKVTRLAPGVVPSGPPDPLPACARDLMITNVKVRGSRTLISGVARLKFANQRVLIRYRPTGNRVIARPRVAANGQFTAVVRRPAKPRVGSNNARYRATIGKTNSAWVKLTRRLVTSNVSYSGTKLRVKGRVTAPIAPGRRLQINRSDACGRYRTIGTVTVGRNGIFNGAVTTPPTNTSSAALIRLVVKVRAGRGSKPNRQITTYSIVQPVLLVAR